jgi:hypothetical protein
MELRDALLQLADSFMQHGPAAFGGVAPEPCARCWQQRLALCTPHASEHKQAQDKQQRLTES